jgi:hypothetical protein
MLEVNAKAVFLPERLLHRRKKVFLAVYSLAALPAY